MAERSKKMSYNEIVHILALYRENKCLWDFSHEHYKNKQKRNKAFEYIKNATNAESTDEVKRRLKIIRDTYNIERNKMKRPRAETGENYRTKLSWYQMADEFLSKSERSSFHDVPNASLYEFEPASSSQQYHSNSSPESQEPDQPEATDVPSEYKPEYVIDFEHAEVASWPVIDENHQHPVNPAPSVTQKTKIRPTQYSSKRTRRDALDRLDSISSPPLAVPSVPDEFHYFGLHLAAQFRKLPVLRALMLQEKIQAMVNKDRIDFEKSQYYRSQTPPLPAHVTPHASVFPSNEEVNSLPMALSIGNDATPHSSSSGGPLNIKVESNNFDLS
ncbi:uncharacterized protein LOC129718090 [Wyeomyia smithii]|uniref:uncharacterized protein LOC129718090 n=1 Tax=Wyeomyia smithii TaxID=174621 RepID=UPI002467B9F2|nr:uncharacterized protein LOC129718090 [Wyeomyia smithii]